jgi:hypothetical protein
MIAPIVAIDNPTKVSNGAVAQNLRAMIMLLLLWLSLHIFPLIVLLPEQIS